MQQQILNDLARRIKELRAKHGVSQEKFAHDCGLHRTALGLIETGKSVPRLDTLMVIAEGFGMSVSELLDGLHRVRAKKK